MIEPDPNPLAEKLRSWKVEMPVPADFQRQVWHRIAAHQAARDEARWPTLEWLGQLFVRPAFALLIVLASTGAGVTLARGKAHETHVRTWKALEDRYANSINPLARHLDHLDHLGR